MIALVSQPPKVDWIRFALAPLDELSDEWESLGLDVGEDHLARQIDRRVDALDLTDLIDRYSFSGSPPIRQPVDVTFARRPLGIAPTLLQVSDVAMFLGVRRGVSVH